MKNQLVCLIALALLTMVACKEADTAKQSETVEEIASPDYAAFDKNLAVMRSFIKAHCDEDFNALTELISDTMKWSPPFYNGNKWLGKEDWLGGLKSYHEGFDNIKFTEGITLQDRTINGNYAGSVFPKETATNSPDAMRLYGTWTATHTASGKEIGVKWYAICWVNDAGKIAMFTEYWDVNGLAVQLAEE